LTSQIILDSSLSSVLMRGGHFASLGYHYGKGSTALTLHRGGKTSTYHVVCVEETVAVPLCQWVAIAALVEQGYYGTCSDAVPHEGSTWSAEVVDEVMRWVLEAAVGLVRLGRGEAGLRRLDGGLVKSAAVGGVAVGDEETTR
jgi:hypothetical protein